jgi:hypothetical protein
MKCYLFIILLGTHYLAATTVAFNGNYPLAKPAWEPEEELPASIPVAFKSALVNIQPNPFKCEAILTYFVPFNSGNKNTASRLRIYDINGTMVRELLNGIQTSGTYRVLWDAKDSHGKDVKNGIYFYEYITGDKKETNRIIFLK